MIWSKLESTVIFYFAPAIDCGKHGVGGLGMRLLVLSQRKVLDHLVETVTLTILGGGKEKVDSWTVCT